MEHISKKQSGYLNKIFGTIFIIIGIIFYFTPIPGTTALIILGFIWFIGPKKTLSFLNKHLSKENIKRLRIKLLVKKLK